MYKKAQKKYTTLYCFSPPVMLATFVIELGLALYVIYRYRLNATTRLIVLTLLLLAIFQISEYFVCGGFGINHDVWSKIGYVAITALPPLGLHILYRISGNPARKVVGFAYATMVGFMAFFLLSGNALAAHECTGNYVIFQIGIGASQAYGLYYYGWLLTAISLGYRELKVSKLTRSARQAVVALIVGYFIFLIPTGIANTVTPASRSGIPSIMCGFAIFFALILALHITPRVSRTRKAKQNDKL